jgi:hypothetical protein
LHCERFGLLQSPKVVIKHRKIRFVYNDPPRGQARPDNKIEELQKRLVIEEGL